MGTTQDRGVVLCDYTASLFNPYFIRDAIMNPAKVLFTFGTRPEAIKMAPVVQVFQADSAWQAKVVLTAQHREMLDQVMEIFDLSSDYDFNIMQKTQTLEFITSGVLQQFSEVIQQEKPDLIMVHGDTTTTYSASMAGFYHHIPVAHVEAGLRSYDMKNPFPEEMNRRLTDVLCQLHFCPTKQAKLNIQQEHITSQLLTITGNTVIDALMQALSHLRKPEDGQNTHQKKILMTMHRRESWGKPIESVARAVKTVCLENPDVQVLFPIHKNPIVRDSIFPILGGLQQVNLVEPMDYLNFIDAMSKSHIIISDSGGIQEEAPTLGIPVLLTREVTERPEGIASGVVKLVGTDTETVQQELIHLLRDEQYYQTMVTKKNPFGDGLAAKRILKQAKCWASQPLSDELKQLGEFEA